MKKTFLLFLTLILSYNLASANTLPNCDTPEITQKVLFLFEKIPLFYNNPYYTLISKRIISPTPVKYDPVLPRYECRALISYDYNTTVIDKAGENHYGNIMETTYSISLSYGKPVVYAKFIY